MITTTQIIREWIIDSANKDGGISEVVKGYAASIQLVNGVYEVYSIYGSPVMTTEDEEKAFRMLGL